MSLLPRIDHLHTCLPFHQQNVRTAQYSATLLGSLRGWENVPLSLHQKAFELDSRSFYQGLVQFSALANVALSQLTSYLQAELPTV